MAVGLILSLLFILGGHLGWGLTLATPLTIGLLLGYGVGVRSRLVIVLCIPCLLAIVGGLYAAQSIGIFCGFVLGALFLIPMLLGVAFGSALRAYLKVTTFDQRGYLPLFLLALLPLGAHAAELLLGGRISPESVSTTAVLPVPIHAAWKSHVFRADSEPAPQAAYRAGLTRPTGTAGSTAIGGQFTIHFTKGFLTVRITQRLEDSLLAYRFIGQSDIEDRAVRLLDGRQEFHSLGPMRTQVTVTTRYQPLVTPRWYWRPFERWAGDTTHHYLLDAMAMDAADHPPKR